MGDPVLKHKRFTVEEYLTLLQEVEEKYEFEEGRLVMMGQTTDIHNELVFNVRASIKEAVQSRGCKVYSESVSVEVDAEKKYYLPDVVLTCDSRDLLDRKIKRYPGLIVEVISPGSIKRDKDIKFQAYLKIEALRYYLLVMQDRVRIEVYSKHPDTKGWHFNYYESLTDIIPLDLLDIQLRVADVYDEVDLLQEGEEA